MKERTCEIFPFQNFIPQLSIIYIAGRDGGLKIKSPRQRTATFWAQVCGEYVLCSWSNNTLHNNIWRARKMLCFVLLLCLQIPAIDILYTLDSASLLVKLKPRIFQRLLASGNDQHGRHLFIDGGHVGRSHLLINA